MHAAGGRRLAEPILVICAVNINIAIVRIDIVPGVHAGFESAQPKNSRGDEIFSLHVLIELVEMFS